jgi:hypothetical protein|tara:strand:+ start:336 stop:572 length:237 start_codon:yes stop_codon:yes gene_type:complete
MKKLYSFKGGTTDGDKRYTAGQVRAIKSVKGMNKYSIELSDAEIKDIREMSKIRRGAVEKAINVFITTQIMNKDKRYK